MLPHKVCDSVNCLEKLVGIRADCKNQDCADYYIEDVEGLDIDKLAQMAGVQEVSGIETAKGLIHTASMEMLGDIELLIGNGYSLKDTLGDVCSDCDFLTFYQANSGIKIQNAIGSPYSFMMVTKLDILTDFTGTAVLVFDDTKAKTKFNVELTAGVIAPVLFSYKTTERVVNIYFEDTSIRTAQIQCASTGGCGCGGAKNLAATTSIIYTGMTGTSPSKTQYGFRACAAVQCSSDMLVCDLLQKTPKIFGLTLLYKVGQKAYSSSRLAMERITPFTSDNQDEKKKDMVAYFENLYKQRLNGRGVTKGIASIINSYLRQRIDRCVTCESNSVRGWATG